MQKRTVALVLALIGAPTLLNGCRGSGRDDCDPQTDPNCNNRGGYRGGGYYGGYGSRYRSGDDGSGQTARGGFGSWGRRFFSGS